MILIKFYGTDNLVLSNSFGKLKSLHAYHMSKLTEIIDTLTHTQTME